MCSIENNYIPPGPEQYEKLAKYIDASVALSYLDEQNTLKNTQGILKNIEVNNYAEYLIVENLSIRLDKVVSVSKA